MKKLLIFAFLTVALAAKAQYLGVFFHDNVGKYTNIRNAPNGKIVDKVETGSIAMLGVENPVNGWWRITDGSYDEPDVGEIKFKGSKTGYYIHYSCIGIGTRNYGGETLYLRSTPSKRGKVVFSFKDERVLRPMEIKGNWVKVQTLDGKHTGWIDAEWLCGNSLTNCC